VSFWLDLGESLINRQRAKVRDAEGTLKKADTEVSELETLLVEARRAQVAARQTLENERGLFARLETKMGGRKV